MPFCEPVEDGEGMSLVACIDDCKREDFDRFFLRLQLY